MIHKEDRNNNSLYHKLNNKLDWIIIVIPYIIFISFFANLFVYPFIGIPGVIIFVVSVIAFWLGLLNRKFRKYTGQILGIVLLVGCIYLLLYWKHLSILTFLRSIHSISIIGTWLTLIGFIGPSRLEQWEKRINLYSQEKIDKNSEVINEIVRKFGLILIVVLPLSCLITLILLFFSNIKGEVAAGILIGILGAFFILGTLYPFIGYAILIPIQVLKLPYRYIGHLEKTSVLTRSMMFLGGILLTIGFIFKL